MLRVISEVKPTYVVGENVRGLVNWNGGMVFEEVCVDLEAQGYEVQPILLAAAGVGAPHRRDRIWFVAYNAAYSNSGRLERSEEVRWNSINAERESEFGTATNAKCNGGRKDNRIRESRFNDENSKRNDWQNFPTQSPICSGDDGLPTELDGITFSKWRKESIKGYGNAICPQVAFEIFKVIAEMDAREKAQLKLF
jgi:DNA (cytosine-5)-methyltransferase 1